MDDYPLVVVPGVIVPPNTITTQAIISVVPTTSAAYYMDNLNYVEGAAVVPTVAAIASATSSDNNYLINEYDEASAQLINQNYDESGGGVGGGGAYSEYTDFYQQAVPNRGRGGRRKSRELPEPPVKLPAPPPRPIEVNAVVVATETASSEHAKRKPETMRSISEDTGKSPSKPSTRRAMSHPEKENTQKVEGLPEPPQSAMPAPKMTFAEILAAKKKSQPSRKKNATNLDSSLSPSKF